MVMKTYSYHVYQPKAKSKHGRFVDLDSKTAGDAASRIPKRSGSNVRRPSTLPTSSFSSAAMPAPPRTMSPSQLSGGMDSSPSSGLTAQLFAATHQAILQSQRPPTAAHGSAKSSSFASANQYTFTTFKMKGRTSTSQPPSKRPGAPAGQSLSQLPYPNNYFGQQPLAIRPMLLPDVGMLPGGLNLMRMPGSVGSSSSGLPPLIPLAQADFSGHSTAASTPGNTGASTPTSISPNPVHMAPLSAQQLSSLMMAATPPMSCSSMHSFSEATTPPRSSHSTPILPAGFLDSFDPLFTMDGGMPTALSEFMLTTMSDSDFAPLSASMETAFTNMSSPHSTSSLDSSSSASDATATLASFDTGSLHHGFGTTGGMSAMDEAMMSSMLASDANDAWDASSHSSGSASVDLFEGSLLDENFLL